MRLSLGPANNGSGPSTVSNGYTFYLNSVYISIQEVYAQDACGTPIGSSYPGHILTLASSDVSSARYGTVDSNALLAHIDYLAYPFNYADLNYPIPWSAYSGQSSCHCVYGTADPSIPIESCPCSTIVNSDYRPALVVPPQVRTLDPAWSHCAIPFGGFYDPPHALTAQGSADVPDPIPWPAPEVLTNAPTLVIPHASPTAAPVATVPKPGPQITGDPQPGKAPLPPDSPEKPTGSSDPNGNEGDEASSETDPDTDDTDTSRPQGGDLIVRPPAQNNGGKGDGPGTPTPDSVWGIISAAFSSPGAPSNAGIHSTPTAPDKGSEAPSKVQGSTEGEDPHSQVQDHGQFSGESGGSDPGNDPHRADAGAVGSDIPAVLEAGWKQDQGDDDADNSSGPSIANVDDIGSNPTAVDGLKIAKDPSDPSVAVVNGHKVAMSAPATTINNVPVSLGDQGLVIAENKGDAPKTVALPNAAAKPTVTPAPLRVGNVQITADSAGAYTLSAGTVLTPSGVATLSGTRISLASNGLFALIGSSTQLLGPSNTAPTPGLLTLGTAVLHPDATGAYMLGPGTTLTPGGVATLDGTRISLAANDAFVVIGSSTEFLQPQRTLPPLTVAGHVYTADGAGEYVITPGETLTPGGEVTVDGVVVSLAADERFAVVGGSTEVLGAEMSATSSGVGIGEPSNTNGAAVATGVGTGVESGTVSGKVRMTCWSIIGLWNMSSVVIGLVTVVILL
ncbi:MAG: hypothetical protein Q9157_001242 [Trypethelium eluteriae]